MTPRRLPFLKKDDDRETGDRETVHDHDAEVLRSYRSLERR